MISRAWFVFLAWIGPLQDSVTWYGINYTGTQMTQWDFQTKGILTRPARLSFVLEVPLRHLRPSVIYSVPCDRILQGAYLRCLFISLVTVENVWYSHEYCMHLPLLLIFRVECSKTKKTLFTELKKLLKEKLKKALTDARSIPNMLRLQFDSLWGEGSTLLLEYRVAKRMQHSWEKGLLWSVEMLPVVELVGI